MRSLLVLSVYPSPPKRSSTAKMPCCFSLVGLSEINSKNYRAILAHKAKLKESPNNLLLTYERASSVNDYTITELKEQHKQLTEEEIAIIVLCYKAGASAYDLAIEFNCHRSTISRNLKKQGIEVTTEKVKRTGLINQVISMYANWEKPKDIGTKLGINAATVLKILKDNDVYIRKSYEYPRSK